MYNAVLVTGGCGFIGSNFLNFSVSKYPDTMFINIDIMNYCSSLSNLKISNYKNYKFFKDDVKNKKIIDYILKIYKIDCVIHFAAQSHVDNSFSEPLIFTQDNIVATHVLLESCREYGNIKKFLHISTDEVYGESDLDTEIEKYETTPINPTTPYASTKASAELIVNSYIKTFGFPAIILRPNNIYGVNQYPEKVIPKFIKNIYTNNKCSIHGNGLNKRSFLHVDDMVNAIEIILHKGELKNIYNIGSIDEFTVIDIAKKIIRIIKPHDEYTDFVEYVDDRVYNDTRYLINSDKLKNIGWVQKTHFENGLLDLIKG